MGLKTECKDCKKEYEKSGCPTCYSCMMKEHDKELKLNEFKYPKLIKILDELGYNVEIEMSELGHYPDYSYLTNKDNEPIENFTPENLVELYEKIKETNK